MWAYELEESQTLDSSWDQFKLQLSICVAAFQEIVISLLLKKKDHNHLFVLHDVDVYHNNVEQRAAIGIYASELATFIEFYNDSYHR